MTEEKNNSHYANEDDIEIDLRQLISVFRKWSRLIIVMTLLSAFCIWVVSSYIMKPVYQAQTLLMVTMATDKLQVDPRSVSGGELENLVGSVSRIPVLTMSTYLGQIKSEALMTRIIKALDLPYSPAELSGMIEATVVKDSNLIEIKVNNHDPALASQIANSLSEQYLQLMTDNNQEQMSRSVTFLEKQQAITDQELRKAELALKNFQGLPRGVVVLETEFNQKSTSLAELTSQLQLARVELQQLSSGVEKLEQELAITPPVFTVEKWNNATGSTGPSGEVNPLYVSIAQELATKKAALAEKQGQIGGLESIVGVMSSELDQLQAELSSKRLQQDNLQRDVDRLRQTSETLAQKGIETKIAKSVDLGDTTVVVISAASIPDSPIKPNKKLNVAIALVLGLMVFSLLAFILEYLDNTIKTPEDVQKHLGLSVMGTIPQR